MKNIYDVMRQKEAEIQQLQKEIEALRVAARLLADDTEMTTAATSVAPPPTLRPTTPAPTVGKGADVTYSAARESSLRQFP